jgi:hypothetical protein
VDRIYQWLSERARFFRSERSVRDTCRTVRTEVTVERQGLTILVGSATEIFDVCPLCGNKLAPERAKQAVTGLQKGSISQVPTSATEERGKQGS